MKTLSVKNPWAHLLVAGLKDVENRSWPTKYRGRVLIHASQKIDSRFREMSLLFTLDQWNALPFEENEKAVKGVYTNSAIIGEVEIINCVQNSASIWAEPGQWHWIIANPIMYMEPIINVKGSLSLWEYKL